MRIDAAEKALPETAVPAVAALVMSVPSAVSVVWSIVYTTGKVAVTPRAVASNKLLSTLISAAAGAVIFE